MRTDPRTLVHEVDKTTAPDLWSEIQGRRPGPPLPGPSNKSRLAAGALAFVVAAGALTFAYQALRPAPDPSPGNRTNEVVPAKPGQATHLLSDFEIEYPYVDPAGNIDPAAVGVSYTSEWATDLNPGTTTCEMQAIAPDGAIAGEATFYLANNVDDPTRHDAVDVPVTAKPVSAQGYCGPADPDQAIARYEITNLRIKGDHLLGSVNWVGGIDPVEQFCQATFQRSDGTSKVVPFSLMAPEGDQDILLMGPEAASELTPESVSCEPFAGQPDLTDTINGIKNG